MQFGSYDIDIDQVFFKRKHCFGMVNYKPVKRGSHYTYAMANFSLGHVLVVSNRIVPRYSDLNKDEIAEMGICVQLTIAALRSIYNEESASIAIQDGPDAGQTVPHVHIHVIPRTKGDFKHNDDLYDKLEEPESMHVDEEKRSVRSAVDMAVETRIMRQYFDENCDGWDKR